MTRRRLTAEEIKLWHQVVEKTERLHTTANPPRPLPKPKPAKTPAPRVAATPEAPPVKPAPRLGIQGQTPKPEPVLMDRKAYGRMKRGKLVPERRIDLHGMTLDRAHPALTRFILSAQASGLRLVLVITGKGKAGADDSPIPGMRGILRRNVPIWLSMPPLAQAVMQVTPAHVSHGGEGAVYVYLRRSR
ncbi:Smr/MutS family protein [Sedimentitalea sp. JM2-8]|uniref:Smr/MutS family protein n=1 Tax=Sedimentitalea xiamensis TaxID=3050037 RepID=A0ABT7F9L9_9RHOB|nr:Smr/MutS family protein [Sedimentitalea xiamensis]MDK3071790.1 Smr/MutS family protein [Sedimentitalea xiamensis]